MMLPCLPLRPLHVSLVVPSAMSAAIRGIPVSIPSIQSHSSFSFLPSLEYNRYSVPQDVDEMWIYHHPSHRYSTIYPSISMSSSLTHLSSAFHACFSCTSIFGGGIYMIISNLAGVMTSSNAHVCRHSISSTICLSLTAACGSAGELCRCLRCCLVTRCWLSSEFGDDDDVEAGEQ